MARNYYAKDSIGTDIKDATGEKVGQVEDMVISPEGNVEFIVVSYDGILGTTLADKLAAVPYNQCGWDEADNCVTLSFTKDRLEQAPTFDKNNVPETSADYYSESTSYYTGSRNAA